MVTAQCLEKTASNIQLVDRQNVKFPVKRNCRHCYNTIYNSLPLSLLKNATEILDMKAKNIRLDFTIETKEETSLILNKFIQAYYYGDLSIKVLKDTTRVHFNRGIK